MKKLLECPVCRSANTEVHVDESIDLAGDENIIITAHCNDCRYEWPLPDDLDWRDYR